MFRHNIYVLGESDPFVIKEHEDVKVNLELKNISPCYHTIFTGKVLYMGMPLRNATVMVMDENSNTVSNTITDANGIYKFSNILKPGKYKVIASSTGYDTSNTKTIIINSDEVTKLSFSLKKSAIFANGIVYGRILETESKKPIENAEVYLKSLGNDEIIYKTTSNHNGQYMIYNVLPNNYKILIQKQGYIVIKSKVIEINKSSHRICLDFYLIKNFEECKNIIIAMALFNIIILISLLQ